jgi:hypothetical protein
MPPNKKRNKSKYTARDPKSIARVSRLLRKLIGIDGRQAPDILEVFSLLRKIFPRLKLQVIPDFILPEAEARAYPRIWTIKIRSGVFEGLLRGDVRARWTLAHELGHITLRHPRRPYRKRIGEEIKGIDRVLEKEANIFATEFLAPTHIAQKYKTVDSIRIAFQISTEAAQHRLDELQRYDGARSRRIAEHDRRDDPFSLEDQLFAVYTSMLTIMSKENSNQKTLVEPIKGDLLYASILIVTAARLLLDAYDSVRKTKCRDNYKVAAAICGAVLYILPIRSAISLKCDTKDMLGINQNCALTAASTLLGINLETMGSELLQRLFRASIDSFQSGYLRPLVCADDISDKDLQGIPNLATTPTFEEYTENHDISWDEIKALENLMNIFQSLEASHRR